MMYPQIDLFTYFAINNSFLKYLSSEMSEDKEVLIKDPENAKLTGAVIQSFYKDVWCLCSEQTGQSQQCSV